MTDEAGKTLLSTGDVARRLDCPRWRIGYVFDAGYLPEPERVGGRRMFREADLDAIGGVLGRLDGRRRGRR